VGQGPKGNAEKNKGGTTGSFFVTRFDHAWPDKLGRNERRHRESLRMLFIRKNSHD
jgi:hypothetical protein